MSAWTVEEKRCLLMALHRFGPSEMAPLKNALPNKTEAEIQQQCQEYSMQALKKQVDNGREASIRRWLQILKKLRNTQPGQINDIIPRVLKYITLFEKREPSDKVDITACYLALQQMSTGLVPEPLNKTTDYFMHECLSKLANRLKCFEVRSYRNHLSELSKIRDLHKHRNKANSRIENSLSLNPLGIPNNLLHLSSAEIKID